jgi:hypothetical protein
MRLAPHPLDLSDNPIDRRLRRALVHHNNQRPLLSYQRNPHGLLG